MPSPASALPPSLPDLRIQQAFLGTNAEGQILVDQQTGQPIIDPSTLCDNFRAALSSRNIDVIKKMSDRRDNSICTAINSLDDKEKKRVINSSFSCNNTDFIKTFIRRLICNNNIELTLISQIKDEIEGNTDYASKKKNILDGLIKEKSEAIDRGRRENSDTEADEIPSSIIDVILEMETQTRFPPIQKVNSKLMPQTSTAANNFSPNQKPENHPEAGQSQNPRKRKSSTLITTPLSEESTFQYQGPGLPEPYPDMLYSPLPTAEEPDFPLSEESTFQYQSKRKCLDEVTTINPKKAMLDNGNSPTRTNEPFNTTKLFMSGNHLGDKNPNYEPNSGPSLTS